MYTYVEYINYCFRKRAAKAKVTVSTPKKTRGPYKKRQRKQDTPECEEVDD
jgi:hypothetical protein